jgi:hypothetical protein
MSGIDPIQFQEVYNLVISTESAQLLATTFNKNPLEIWAPTVAALGSAIAAGISCYTGWKLGKNSLKIQQSSLEIPKNSIKISHDLFIHELDKLYFEIRKDYPDLYDTSNPYTISIMCNFLEKICIHFFQKKISKKRIVYVSIRLKKPKIHTTCP